MKHLLTSFVLVFSVSAFANIDEGSVINIEPKAERVEASRACFSELQKLGCGHPKEDAEHFRTCMSEVYTSLDSGCQTIMKRLYGK
ncbi:hypothetical protein ACJVC5_03620 [Peredibacter sp. HCB2-198]|uniref:hypothetical protein n=1 Tax=Peredibacter sp. HCB2-198 TaxID=3383025 RepID=UPI0038B6A403